ncbi:MAG: Uma2 family endonuclease [Anaerolineae bacterium]|nr:Uma2 family endonuclease [Anaerolineae bacterium]
MFEAQTKPVTAEAFITFILQSENEGRRFELIDGEIVEKMPTQLHALIATLFIFRLSLYFQNNPIGWVFTELRIKLPSDDLNDTIPDISVVLKEGREFNPNEPLTFMPDLAIEIKSPTDSLIKMRKKANYYLENGTKLVWLVDTQRQKVEIYTVDDTEILGVNDTLDGGDLLPNFKLPMTDLWSQK